tara:strand:- start:339 stop:503 length:165 start_codon:yes stop_codon:yes gene_type:complete
MLKHEESVGLFSHGSEGLKLETTEDGVEFIEEVTENLLVAVLALIVGDTADSVV